MAISIVLIIAVALVAFANGANDNFKGVATLYGSGAMSYRRALAWATVTTFLGSLTALWLATTLLRNFSGKGLVDDSLVTNADYSAAVALGAGATVLFATRVGMPISTTHGLVGALVGAGLAAGSTVSFVKLGTSFFLPLLVSPFIAMSITGFVYPILRHARERLGISSEICLCVGNEIIEIVPVGNRAIVQLRTAQLTAAVGDVVSCQNRYQGCLLGVEAGAGLDWLHYLSAGIVSFARGLNDTPKIAALLLLVPLP